MVEQRSQGVGVETSHVVLVAAVADNGVIGSTGQDGGAGIPWHLPEDLKHFKAVTMGHTLVMGRRTFDTIGRPLPGRTNIVVTRQSGWCRDGVLVAPSVESAIELARSHEGDVMVMGGGQIYAAAMPLADRQILTEVHLAPEGDVLYPAFDRSEWVEEKREPHESFDFVWLSRIRHAR